MRQREYMIEHFRLVIHHDVWITTERTGRKRAALLALVGIAIAPAIVQSASQYLAVIGAERLERVDDHFDRLIPGMPRFQFAENWHVGVVMMNVRQLHLPPPEFKVSIQRRQ